MLVPTGSMGGSFTQASFLQFGSKQTQKEIIIFSSPENAEIAKEEMPHKDARVLFVRPVEIIIK